MLLTLTRPSEAAWDRCPAIPIVSSQEKMNMATRKSSSKGPNVWVGPNPKGPGWQVKPEGGKPIAIKPTQEAAEKVGRKAAENNGSELIIQRPNGQIRDKDSHGNETPKPDKR